MQWLYSMFPKGLPGLALLISRVALGLMLISSASGLTPRPDASVVTCAVWVTATSLWIGLATPIACIACISIEVHRQIFETSPEFVVGLCIALQSVALGLLGPGAYSLDGRLFGRRRVII